MKAAMFRPQKKGKVLKLKTSYVICDLFFFFLLSFGTFINKTRSVIVITQFGQKSGHSHIKTKVQYQKK